MVIVALEDFEVKWASEKVKIYLIIAISPELIK